MLHFSLVASIVSATLGAPIVAEVDTNNKFAGGKGTHVGSVVGSESGKMKMNFAHDTASNPKAGRQLNDDASGQPRPSSTYECPDQFPYMRHWKNEPQYKVWCYMQDNGRGAACNVDTDYGVTGADGNPSSWGTNSGYPTCTPSGTGEPEPEPDGPQPPSTPSGNGEPEPDGPQPPSTTASGIASTAMGSNTTASGDYSTAMGIGSTASGFMATAMGGGTPSMYPGGWGATTASGRASTAMGAGTNASGQFSTSMGKTTTAHGMASTAMGGDTSAMGDYATAMGRGTFALGDYATAMGEQSVALNELSTATGLGTLGTSYAETVIGTYNECTPNPTFFGPRGLDDILFPPGFPTLDVLCLDSDEAVFRVGIGTDWYQRKDALTVYKNGNVKINGDLTITGALKQRRRLSDPDGGATKVQAKVQEKIASLEQKIAASAAKQLATEQKLEKLEKLEAAVAALTHRTTREG